MTEEHPLKELADDPQFGDAIQDAVRLGIRFDEMITTLCSITGQNESDARYDLENVMGAFIARKKWKGQQ